MDGKASEVSRNGRITANFRNAASRRKDRSQQKSKLFEVTNIFVCSRAPLFYSKQMNITPERLRLHRLAQSGLSQPFANAEECVRALVGVQAQIPQAAALAVAVRTRGLTLGAFQDLLYNSKRLLRTWGQRHTMHVFDAAGWPEFVAAFRTRHSWAWRLFLEKGGTDEGFEALLAKVDHVLAEDRPLSRAELAPKIGVTLSSWGDLLVEAAYRGILCDAGGNRFAHGRNWAAISAEETDPLEADAALLRRYLASYGPATAADLTHWYGAARLGGALARVGTVEVACGKKRLLTLPEMLPVLEREADPRLAEPILFYRFDPLLLAYRDKDWIVPKAHQRKVWQSAGHVNGVLLENGLAVGTWKYVKKGDIYPIEYSPFAGKPTARQKKAIRAHEKFLADFFSE